MESMGTPVNALQNLWVQLVMKISTPVETTTVKTEEFARVLKTTPNMSAIVLWDSVVKCVKKTLTTASMSFVMKMKNARI